MSINQKQFSRFYRFMAIVLIGLCLSLLAQADEWAATLTATSINTVVAAQTVNFKTVDGATGGYDAGSDGAAPPLAPAPIWLDIYFPVSGNAFITRLVTDAKADTTDSISWSFGLRADSVGGTLSWNVSSIPSDRKVTLTLPDSSTVNMKTAASTAYIAVNGSHLTYTVTVVGDQKPTGLSPTTASVDEDSSSNTITLSATDPEGLTITYAVTINPTNGSLSGTAPNLTYSPNANFNGTDTFTFSASDGTSTVTQEVTITIMVTVNGIPVANAQSTTVKANSSDNSITLSGSDTDGDSLTYLIVSNPGNGQLSGTAPNLTYTPNANYNGNDSFTFKANDGTADSNVATMSITVVANQAPVANDQLVTTNEGTAKTFTLAGTDADNDTLIYRVVTLPPHGQISNWSSSAGTLTYTPNANYSGSDSFTFKVNDGIDDSTVATVTITVSAVNDKPVANDQSVSTSEDTTKLIALSASDADGDSLTYQLLSNPSNGTLSGTAPNLTYTPNANYNGSDSFTFKVNDGIDDSTVATVSITVIAVNKPVANAQSTTVQANSTGNSITLSASDADGDSLTYQLLSNPSNGTLSGTAPNLTYTPNANYNGSDSFTFKANDGIDDSNVATVSITVLANQAPVANSQSVTVNENSAKLIILSASDAEGNTLTYKVVSQPGNGTLGGTAAGAWGSFGLTYSPKSNYHGSDSFTFKANDGKAESNTATVTITVSEVNRAPVANAQEVIVQVNSSGNSITLSASDADGDSLTYQLLNPVSNGTLSGTAPNLTYKPNANFSGNDSFTFRASDGKVNSNSAATVTIYIKVNRAPVANAQEVIVQANSSGNSITLLASDADEGHSLTYQLLSNPSNGTLSGAAPNLTYKPNANFSGTDSFTFRASDGKVNSNTATVTITVSAINRAPVANGKSATVQANSTGNSISLSASDADGDSLTYQLLSNPSNGTLSGTTPNLTYKPNANFSGSDSFTFRASDGKAVSTSATVTITVSAVNRAPVANGKSATVQANSTGNSISLSASDADGDSLTYQLLSNPSNGTLSGTVPNLTYKPNANFSGSDSFTFRASDGKAVSTSATVTITVSAVNRAPVANGKSATVQANSAGNSITLSASDADGNSLTYQLLSNPSNGTLSGTTPNLTYKPNANFSGLDSFTFRASDGKAVSTSATVSIVVQAALKPQIVLSAEKLDFGTLTPKQQANQTLTITNRGTVDLVITSIYSILEETLSSNIKGPLTLKPDQSQQIIVTVKAPNSKGMIDLPLTIVSNDPQTSEKVVWVNAKLVGPILNISPSTLNFGSVGIKESAQAALTLANTGNAKLKVSNIQLGSNLFQLQKPFSSLELDADQKATIEVKFQPLAVGETSTNLIVFSDAGQQEVSLSGSGSQPLALDASETSIETVELNLAATELSASQSATTIVTVTLKNKDGQLVKGTTVNLTVDKGTIQTPATDNGDGSYTAKYTAAGSAGIAKISAVTSNGKFASATVQLLPVTIEISAAKTELLASLASTTDITVTARDSKGNLVTGQTINLTTDKGTIQNLALDNGDGTYTAKYTAAETAGEVKISAVTDSGKFATLSLKLLELVVSKDKSTLEIIGSAALKTGEMSSVLVTLKTEGDVPVSGQEVELKISPEEKVVINPSAKTDKDGKTTITFIAGKSGMKIIKANADDVELASSVAAIFSGEEINLEPVAETVTAVATKTSLEADGESTSKLTITVLDADGDALTDQKLQLEVENGTLGEVVNNNDGTYATTYIAGIKAGEVTITAKTSNNKAGTVKLTLTEKIEKPKLEPTFTVSTLKEEKSGSAGEFVSYLVKLEGKDEFADKVTLFATDPPEGIKIEFAPKEVSLSAEEALQTSQMTLTLSKDVAAKDYEITALATSASGSVQKLTVTVKVESADLAATSILLTVKPKELQLSQSLEVFGQLANISDAEVEIPANSVINLMLTPPSDQLVEFKVNTAEDGNYQLATPYTPDEVGEWEISANFEGTKTLKASKRSIKFTVAKGTAVISFSNENSAALGSEIELVGNLKPQLAEQTVSLKIIKPDGSVPTPTNIQTGELGVFTHRQKLNLSGNWEFTATWAGNDNYESVTKTLSVAVSSEVGKAILVLGGGNRQNNKDWRTFSSVAQHVYKVFLKRQFDADDDIHYLSPEPKVSEGADTVTTLDTLELAITNWAKKQVNPQVPLYIYLLSHNLGDKFLLEKSGNQEKYLSPQLLDTWLDQLPEGTPVTVVIEACYSGNFISSNGTPTALAGENRTIIVSARGDRQSKIARSSSFSRTFFSYIESNKPVGEAFDQTVRRMEKMQYHRGQHPEMDSNGDGNVNQPEDYALLRERYLPADLISLANPPELTKITEATTLKKGISSLRIEVEVVGTNITHVYATVVPPTYDPTTEIASWSELEFDEFDLGKVSEGKYAATYANFTLAGDYAVIVNAENADGFADPIQTIITVAGEEEKPVTKPKLAGDVNGDNSVNIFDLVMVAGQFGKSGAGLSGDVNGDSSVNIFDLVMVAGNFGKSNVAAAPTLLASKLIFTTQQKLNIQSAIVELGDMQARSEAEELVFNLLIAILPERLPEQTQLLPNYPNPFNPETWIPFELSQDSNVSITIYDVSGTPVRNIGVGYLQAGSYVSQSKAIYWDGKIDTGERVASGTYFYTLTTQDYTSTQKMIILK